MAATIEIENRMRRGWIVTAAVTITQVLPTSWHRPIVERALALIRPEWRINGQGEWKSMGRVSVLNWDEETGELEIWVHRPEDET